MRIFRRGGGSAEKYKIPNFPLAFDVGSVINFGRLKALLFASAQGGAGGLEFSTIKMGKVQCCSGSYCHEPIAGRVGSAEAREDDG